MKFIIAPCLGQKNAESNLPNNLPCLRAVYCEKDGNAVGLPVMFLRDYGMEVIAEELIALANRP